ncbi:AAA family ATPase [Catenulispora rubra]|uniref:AAA family ATPase n=1 Tax=Catenulispora rubra TaxID=280293 RepID=UPI001892004A|nr:AAA family ATPase [Catenulispora rubra]
MSEPTDHAAVLPAWYREVDLALPVQPQILLSGNVRDVFLLPPAVDDEAENDSEPDEADGSENSENSENYQAENDAEASDLAPYSMVEAIERICEARGFGAVAVHDIVRDGFQITTFTDRLELPPALAALDVARPSTGGGARFGEAPGSIPYGRLRQALVAAVGHRGPAIAVVFPYTSRLGSPRSELSADGRGFFAAAEALGHSASAVPGPEPVTPYNTVFWLVERQDELPAEFDTANHRIRVVSVPAGDSRQRKAACGHVVAQLFAANGHTGHTGHTGDAAAREQAADKLLRSTAGLSNDQILSVARLAQDRKLPPERLDDAVRLYRIGVVDNPWNSDVLRTRIADGEAYLNKRVVGQKAAVRKAVDIFMRSATNLTGAQSSSSPRRPRGVLFLSGPTGVGKTELAKGITTMLFGDDALPLRFDMSEFSQEHARDRLIGAPPGFVGHESGGELTNGVRADPMSVVLFDEIDKADNRVFDIFLQILEDGRLTDGRGDTVYFTDCVLIFTSNLGVFDKNGQPVLTAAVEPATVSRLLRKAFEDFFDKEIKRPELRNRFGDGFVDMGFIDKESVEWILDRCLAAVAGRLAAVHGAVLEVSAEARATLLDVALERAGTQGGRGIGHVVEAALINPLSRELFQRPAGAGETLSILSVTEGEYWTAEVDR